MAFVETHSEADFVVIPPLDRLYFRRVQRSADTIHAFFGQNIFVPVEAPSNDRGVRPADPEAAGASGKWAPWKTTVLVAAASAGLWAAMIAAFASFI